MRDNGTAQPKTAEQDRTWAPGTAKLAGMNDGMRVLSYLISGVVVYGLLGWLGDHLLHTHFLLPIGIILGAGLGCYVIIRRFGRIDDAPAGGPTRPGGTTTDGTTHDAKEGAR